MCAKRSRLPTCPEPSTNVTTETRFNGPKRPRRHNARTSDESPPEARTDALACIVMVKRAGAKHPERRTARLSAT